MIELIDKFDDDVLLTPGRSEFIRLMARARLTKNGLARNFGVNRVTVNRWGRKFPVPEYALAYLRLYIMVKELTEKEKMFVEAAALKAIHCERT